MAPGDNQAVPLANRIVIRYGEKMLILGKINRTIE
jgi:hypothetical protein